MRIRSMWLALAALAPVLLAGRVEAACSLAKIAEIPVTMSSQRPTVPAKINGANTRFFVDTGADFSVMSKIAAVKLGLKLEPAPYGLTLIGAGGQTENVQAVTVQDFDFGDSVHHNVDFLVTDTNFGPNAGVIGQNVFGSADVEYDLANGVIRSFRPTDCDHAVLAYWAGDKPYSMVTIDPTDPRSPGLKARASVNGVGITIKFDTGAMSVLTSGAAARAGVKPTDPGVVSGGYNSGMAQRSYFQTWNGPFASFKLGDEEIKNIRLPFGDMKLTDADMLLGIDFFLSHRIYVAKSQHRVYFTYNGGQVFILNTNSAPPPGAAAVAATAADGTSDNPTDAAGFSRRAAAFTNRRDYANAIADLNRAIELEPGNANFFYRRGMMEMASGKPAMPDFDQALKLKPDDIAALLARAILHLVRAERFLAAASPHPEQARTERLQARADLDAAAGFAAKDPDRRLGVAQGYARADFVPEALQQYDLWIDAHPSDERRVAALSDRCWLRAWSGVAVDKALADCNEALRLAPGDPMVLEHRGLAYLRLGDLDHAIADYNAGLKLRNEAWALYGRGLAEVKKGKTSEGQADIQAATALNPRLPAEAKARGLTP